MTATSSTLFDLFEKQGCPKCGAKLRLDSEGPLMQGADGKNGVSCLVHCDGTAQGEITLIHRWILTLLAD